MTDAKEFMRHVRVAVDAADSATDGGSADAQRCCDVLELLRESAVTAQLLADTDAGKQIRKLSKHEDGRIKQASLRVIEAWKETIRGQAKAAAPSSSGAQAGTVKGEKPAVETALPESVAQALCEAKRSPPPSANEPDMIRQDSLSGKPLKKRPAFSRPAPLGDKTRDHVRACFSEALLMAVIDDYDDVDSPYEIAAAAEAAVWREYNGQAGKDYKAKIRTLLFNLKDPKNPDLRRRVLIGEVSAEGLVGMSSEDLASDATKQEHDKIRANMKKETERSQNVAGNITDMFRCGKCKQRKCTYYQMQTRSADEPMTTFVRCVNCGHRWKFC